MQRGVGKHDSRAGGCPARPRRRPGRRARRGQQHHRPPRRWPAGTSSIVHLAQFPRGRQVGDHQRERLVLPVLARPQRRRGGLAARVHGEVVSPQALDRHHVAIGQQAGRSGQGGPRHFVLLRVEQTEPGPAGRAADRLGMEPAVRRIVVLRLAFRAHGERRHGGQRPVVGHAGDDGEPGPAVGAVDERVAEPPVRRVRQFGQAVVTGRAVGRDQRAAPAGVVAGDDREPGRPGGGHRRRRHPVHPGQRRRLRLQQAQKLLNACCRALDLCEHAIDVVADPPGQAQPGGEGVDEGAEAHPLHDPFHADGCPDDAGHPASLPFPVPASQRLPGRAASAARQPGHRTQPAGAPPDTAGTGPARCRWPLIGRDHDWTRHARCRGAARRDREPAAGAGGSGRAGRVGRRVRLGGRLRRGGVDAAGGHGRPHRPRPPRHHAHPFAVAAPVEGRQPGGDAGPAVRWPGDPRRRRRRHRHRPPRHRRGDRHPRPGRAARRRDRPDACPMGRIDELPRAALRLRVRPRRPQPGLPARPGADPGLGGRRVAAAEVHAPGAALRRHHPAVRGRGPRARPGRCPRRAGLADRTGGRVGPGHGGGGGNTGR